MDALDYEEQVAGIARRLADELGEHPAALIDDVRASFAVWSEARVRDFVPIFVERELRTKYRVAERPVA